VRMWDRSGFVFMTAPTLFDTVEDPRHQLARQAACADFDGPAYNRAADHERLSGQILRIFDLMRDGTWRTLAEIAARTGDPHASISAQLRHLRKARFGAHRIDKRPRGERGGGLWEYRLVIRR